MNEQFVFINEGNGISTIFFLHPALESSDMFEREREKYCQDKGEAKLI